MRRTTFKPTSRPSRFRRSLAERRSRANRRSRGQALVEFALIVPIFMLIAFGTIDFGLAFDASIGISNAAREGARAGVTTPTSAAITARVEEVAGRLNTSALTVAVSCKTAAGAACAGGMNGAVSGTTVVVTVGYSYPMITPIAFGTRIPLSSTAQMRVE
jgi:Flp pilus assembly protein TadG